MAEAVGRVARLLLMVPYVLRKGEVNVSELCERFDISKDTLIDDLDHLFLCGLPDYGPGDLIDYWLEGDRVKIMMADYFRRPLRLTREEGLVTYVAGKAVQDADLVPTDTPLGSAMEKILTIMSEADRVDVEEMAERIRLEMDSLKGKWKKIIEQGLVEEQSLVLEYYSSSSDTVTERKVMPLKLLWAWGHWYLLAYCYQAEEKRLFRLDRIKSLCLGELEEEYSEAEGEIQSMGVYEFHPDAGRHKVCLRFEGGQGRRLWEGVPAAKVTRGKKGAVEVEFRTDNLGWVSRFLLGYGDKVEVLEPKELQELLAERALKTLKNYG